MKRVYLAFGTVLTLMVFCAKARAETKVLTMNASSGTVTKGQCAKFSDGAVTGQVNCTLVFNIPLEAGWTIHSVVYYYYDNASPQYFYGKVGRVSSSTLSDEILGSAISDTTTHEKVQYIIMTINTPIVSSHAYYVYTVVSSNTVLRSVRVNYH